MCNCKELESRVKDLELELEAGLRLSDETFNGMSGDIEEIKTFLNGLGFVCTE